MTTRAILVRDGFLEEQRSDVAALFWAAFRQKLHPVMRPEAAALRLWSGAIDPRHAISASSHDGRLLGVAGYKTTDGSFADVDLRRLRACYGALGGLWRGLVLSVLQRPVMPGTLLMDGIFVDQQARGAGVGSTLLAAIKHKASASGLVRVRLDVIDTNVRARELYERHGFVATETRSIGLLSAVFGFQSATTMICEVKSAPL